MPIAQPAPTVTLEGIELRVLHLPLVSPFTTSFGTETVREVIVARALTADGDGWGEIVTQESPLYSSEYTQGAWDVSLRFLIPALLDRHTLAPEDVNTIAAVTNTEVPRPKVASEGRLLQRELRTASFAMRSTATLPHRLPEGGFTLFCHLLLVVGVRNKVMIM